MTREETAQAKQDAFKAAGSPHFNITQNTSERVETNNSRFANATEEKQAAKERAKERIDGGGRNLWGYDLRKFYKI